MDYLVHLVVMMLARALCLVPFSVSTWLACRVGDVLYLLWSSRREVALRNVEIVFKSSLTSGQKKRLARQAFQHVAVSLTELFLVPKVVKEARFRFRMFNRKFLDEAFRQGKGVILVVSHLGSWEYLSFGSYLTKTRWSVVVKDIRNSHLDHDVNAFRRMTTLNPIPKKDSVREVVRELKQNHLVAILIDQWAGGEGLWQDFFGRPTSTTSIPARLALRFGSALVPAYCFRTSPGFYDIEFHAPVSIEGCKEGQVTQKLNALLEEQIKAHPDQWAWAHRRWKPKPAYTRESEN